MALVELVEYIDSLGLIDHHVHSCVAKPPSRAAFEQMLTESDRSAPKGAGPFFSQLGFAIRRHCAPLLGLPEHADPEEYYAARAARTPNELAGLFLSRSGVDQWWVDTGYQSQDLMDLERFGRVCGRHVREVVRVESVLEEVASESAPHTLEADFTEALESATRDAVAVKSIIAYRHGFAFDVSRPTAAQVEQAAKTWLRSSRPLRVKDPILLRMALWAGVDTGLPIQLHAGFGDPDLDLQRCDPALLTPWLRAVEPLGTRIVLLHCYPYHRNAGFLAQAFPHVYFDVGLAVNYTGAGADRVIAESLELAPFGKMLYSSDAWGLPELHYLGSVLWRRALRRTLSAWVSTGDWNLEDAVGVATAIGRRNALELYGVADA